MDVEEVEVVEEVIVDIGGGELKVVWGWGDAVEGGCC